MRVVVAFGSNLGDRRQTLIDAAAEVGWLLDNFTLSSIVETAPVGAGLENDPPYLNAVAVGESTLTPRAIFEALRQIEASAGRTRAYQGAPRTLDLDLILAGDEVVDEGDLQVPHPRFRDRQGPGDLRACGAAGGRQRPQGSRLRSGGPIEPHVGARPDEDPL